MSKRSSSLPEPGSPEAPLYQQGNFSREASMGYLMRRISMMMVAEVDHRLTAIGLTHAQWAPLLLIKRGKANTQAELARELQLDAGALTRTLDRLEAKGLCRRERSTEDRRVVNLSLTPEGEVAIEPVAGVLCQVSNQMLEGFQSEQYEALMAGLRQVFANTLAMRATSECKAKGAERRGA